MKGSILYVFGHVKAVALPKNVLPERKRKRKCVHSPVMFANDAVLLRGCGRIIQVAEKVIGTPKSQ